jgi:hypothetical protein
LVGTIRDKLEEIIMDFKSFNVVLKADHIVLERERPDGTQASSLSYNKDELRYHINMGTFNNLPDNIQADIKSANELLKTS